MHDEIACKYSIVRKATFTKVLLILVPLFYSYMWVAQSRGEAGCFKCSKAGQLKASLGGEA